MGQNSDSIGTFRTRLTQEVDEPHGRAVQLARAGLLSNIYPIKMRVSIEFLWAMHIEEVDL